MRKFSIRPTLTLKGRTFNGLRGWAGKPLHPPLTDIPITAYFLAAIFDVISAIGGKDNSWAGEFWHAGTSNCAKSRPSRQHVVDEIQSCGFFQDMKGYPAT